MKHKLVLMLAVSVSITYPLYSQEDILLPRDKPVDETNTPIVLPTLVLHNDIWSNAYPFTLLDGTPLPFKDTIRLFEVVPSNETLLRKEKQSRIARACCALLVSAGAITYTGFWNSDSPNAEIIKTVSFTTEMVAALGVFILSGMQQNYLHRAADNYNLYSMGIPIPHK